MNGKILSLLPVFVFMISMLAVSVILRRSNAKKESQGFVKEYFIALGVSKNVTKQFFVCFFVYVRSFVCKFAHNLYTYLSNKRINKIQF